MFSIIYLSVFVVVLIGIAISPKKIEWLDKKFPVQPHYEGGDLYYEDQTGYANLAKGKKILENIEYSFKHFKFPPKITHNK